MHQPTRRKEKFLSSAHLCQLTLNSGDLKEAKNYMRKIKSEQVDFLKTCKLKPFHYFLEARIHKESGQFEESKQNINKALNAWETKGEIRRIAQYLQRAEILLLLGENDKAKEDIGKVTSLINNNEKEFKTMLTRNLRLEAVILGDDENSLKIIDKSIKMLSIEGNADRNPYLADCYVTKADILERQKSYQEALDLYYKAQEIYKEAYNNKVELDRIGELYRKIVNISISVMDLQISERYYVLHKEAFGPDHPRSIEINKLIIKERLH